MIIASISDINTKVKVQFLKILRLFKVVYMLLYFVSKHIKNVYISSFYLKNVFPYLNVY